MKMIYEITRTQVTRVEAESASEAYKKAELLSDQEWVNTSPVIAHTEDPTVKEEALIAEQDLKVTVMLHLYRYGESAEEIQARVEDEEKIIREAINEIENCKRSMFVAERLGEIRYRPQED